MQRDPPLLQGAKAAGYDQNASVLELEHRHGRLEPYPGLPPTIWPVFLMCQQQETDFRENIAGSDLKTIVEPVSRSRF